MKLGKKPIQLKYKLSQIPPDLQNYFYVRWAVSVGALVVVPIVFLCSSLYQALFVVVLGILAYVGYVFYNFFRMLSGNVILIQGICQSRDSEYFKVSNPIFKKTNFMNVFEYYGKSSITIDMDGVKIIAPVRHNFPAKEGQLVSIYCFADDTYPDTDNSYKINCPLLVKVTQI